VIQGFSVRRDPRSQRVLARLGELGGEKGYF
jgi:hypothetical protein